MSPLSGSIVRTWQATLLAACACTAAKLTFYGEEGVEEVWRYRAQEWVGTPSIRSLVVQATQLLRLGKRLLVRLGGDLPAYNAPSDDPATSYWRGMVQALWRLEYDYGGVANSNLADLCRLAGVVERVLLLMSLIHQRYLVHPDEHPCHQPFGMVGNELLEQLVGSMIQQLGGLSGHLASPHHKVPIPPSDGQPSPPRPLPAVLLPAFSLEDYARRLEAGEQSEGDTVAYRNWMQAIEDEEISVEHAIYLGALAATVPPPSTTGSLPGLGARGGDDAIQAPFYSEAPATTVSPSPTTGGPLGPGARDGDEVHPAPIYLGAPALTVPPPPTTGGLLVLEPRGDDEANPAPTYLAAPATSVPPPSTTGGLLGQGPRCEDEANPAPRGADGREASGGVSSGESALGGGPEPVIGGPCGMFSPSGAAEERGEEVTTPTGRPPRGNLASASRGGGPQPSPDVRSMAAAAANLLGRGAYVSNERFEGLQSEVKDLTAMMRELLSMAKGMGLPFPSSTPQAAASAEQKPAGIPTRRPATAPLEQKSEVAESLAEEVTLLKLDSDRRKERRAILNGAIPWGKGLLVLHDKAGVLRPWLHATYGPVKFGNLGTVAALDDTRLMYRGFAYGPTGAPGEHAWQYLAFGFTPAVVLGTVYLRFGGPYRADHHLYIKTVDLKPVQDGEDRQLARVDPSMFIPEPKWGNRKAPTTMGGFRDQGLRMATLMGLHIGERAQHELAITVEFLFMKGSRAPALLNPAMACHLLDLMISTVLEASYSLAAGEDPLHPGTDSLTPAQVEDWTARRFTTRGFTFLLSTDSIFMRREWGDLVLMASMCDGDRSLEVLRLMGMDVPKSQPPKGGPTGGQAPAPQADTPQDVPRRPGFRQQEADDAGRSLLNGACPLPVCMKHLSKRGCQRGAQCKFHHVAITAGQLRQSYLASEPLRKILNLFDGPSQVDVPYMATATSQPGAGRSGGQGLQAPMTGGQDEAEETVSPSGVASDLPIQVPYPLYVGDDYPRARRDDARSVRLVNEPSRPQTVHHDPPAQPLDATTDALYLRPPSMRRAGQGIFMYTAPDAAGQFHLRLGPHVLVGMDAGHVLVMPGGLVQNACVTLAFAHCLQQEPVQLFSELIAEARAVSTALGPPAVMETATVVLLRSMCHDILASLDQGHPLDALTYYHFPPQALHGRTVALVHVEGETVALDVLRGPAADPAAAVSILLQRKGSPAGHMMPCHQSTVTLASLMEWASEAHLAVRLLDVLPWRQRLAADAGGATCRWAAHGVCDFCQEPRFPLPSLPSA